MMIITVANDTSENVLCTVSYDRAIFYINMQKIQFHVNKFENPLNKSVFSSPKGITFVGDVAIILVHKFKVANIFCLGL